MSDILDYGRHFIEKILSEHHKNAFIEFLDLKNVGIDTKFNPMVNVQEKRQNWLID